MRGSAALSIFLILGVPLSQWLETGPRRGGGEAGFAEAYSWVAMGAVLASLTVAYARFIPPFTRYFLGHLGQAAIFVLLLLMAWGLLGVGLGIPNLIWDEGPVHRFASSLGATLLLALLGANAYYLGINPTDEEGNETIREMRGYLGRFGRRRRLGSWLELDPRGVRPDQVIRRDLSLFLRLARLPFLVLIGLPALFPRIFTYVPWNVDGRSLGVEVVGNIRNDWRCYAFGLAVWAGGAACGVLLVKLLLRASAVVNDAWSRVAALLARPGDEARAGGRMRGVLDRLSVAAPRGFEQYWFVVLIIYGFMAVGSAESGSIRWLAGASLFVAGLPPLIAPFRPGSRLRAVDAAATVLLGLLILGGGWLTIRTQVGTPAFAIFALLGLLATVHVVYERRDARPVYFLFGVILAALVLLIPLRVGAGEPITPHDLLAVAALAPVAAFGLALRLARAPGRPIEAWRAWLLPPLGFGLGLCLAWAAGPPDAPPVVLAGLFCLTGCMALMLEAAPSAAGGGDGRQTPRRILLTSALALWILLVNYDPFKNRFDGLDYGGVASKEKVSKILGKTYPYDILELAPPAAPPPAPASPTPPVLLENRRVLEAWKAHVAGGREGAPKPKLVLVCVSGGAIRSAYWAANVLHRLGVHPGLEDFHDHVRLITGASGGMVATAYYEAARLKWVGDGGAPSPGARFEFEPDRVVIPPIGPDRVGIPPKSLDKVARFIALQSPWRMLLPRMPGWAADDRGLVLERDWEAIRAVKFADIRDAESKGEVPSLIFSPMIVDDGRRLLISNLDLMSHQELRADDQAERERALGEWPIPVARQNDLDNDNDGARRNSFSISALELFKLDPAAAATLSLATAARMSATFPFVSPAVNLPTNPPLRVVDAGYYDNYGVHLANAWLLQNRAWIRRNTSGVLVVQTRDSVSKRDRLGVPSESKGFFDRIFQGAGLFGSVSDAILRARYSTTTFRNDQESIAVNEVFRGMGADPGFVATAVFENSAYLSTDATDVGTAAQQARKRWPGLDDPSASAGASDVPMSWYLTTDEQHAIRDAIPPVPGDRAYTLMLRNFARDRAFFRKDLKRRRPGEARPSVLGYALKFAAMSAAPSDEESRTLLDSPEELDARVERLDGRFGDLGTIIECLHPADGGQGGAESGTEAALRERGRRLAGAGRIPELIPDREAARRLEQLLSTPGAGPSADELDRLGAVIAAAADDVGTPLDERTVLLFAHTEWINGRAGFESSKPAGSDADAGSNGAYYTREFERVMNYHRLEAVRHWWTKDHSAPETPPGGDAGG